MNLWKFIQRICLILCVALLAAIIAFRFFLPKIKEQRDLRAQAEAVRQNIQREAEQLRMLKLKQEKLQEDPRFIEKIAREDLGYAKPGETVFRFVDEEKP
jgi:cell division protein DivIC